MQSHDRNSLTETLLAFDVGARTHEFVHETAGKLEQGQLQNDISAVRSFLARLLKDGRRLRVIMEATGIYFLDLALVAHELGAEVVVINPKAGHHFAKGLGLRSKTDAIDARMLLEFLRRMPLTRWEPRIEVIDVKSFPESNGSLRVQVDYVVNATNSRQSVSTNISNGSR